MQTTLARRSTSAPKLQMKVDLSARKPARDYFNLWCPAKHSKRLQQLYTELELVTKSGETLASILKEARESLEL